MGNIGNNTPTYAAGLVTGAVLAMVVLAVCFRGNIHF